MGNEACDAHFCVCNTCCTCTLINDHEKKNQYLGHKFDAQTVPCALTIERMNQRDKRQSANVVIHALS